MMAIKDTRRKCQNCGGAFFSRKREQVYCSIECRVVPIKKAMIGEKYGWLIVLKELDRGVKSGKPQRRFLCKCKCGEIIERTYDNIIHKGLKTPSCGCFMHYFASNRIKHGMSNTKIYNVWAALKVRCYKKDDPSYAKYGAKGVTVCERWKSFENFYADMGGTYKEGLTIDRYPNKKGDYEPNNCRWATYKQQGRNLSSNKVVSVLGHTMCVSEFAEIVGCSRGIIYRRLKMGWCDEDAILDKDIKIKKERQQKIYEHYASAKG